MRQCPYGAVGLICVSSAADFQATAANHFISLFSLDLIARKNQHQDSKANCAVKQALHTTNEFSEV